jgi:hypothetical protein
MRRFAATLLAGTLLSVFAPLPSFASDVVYGVLIDGRPLDAKRHSGLNHDGVTYINVVRAVKAFDGLLTFGRGGQVRVTVNGRALRYRIGRRIALLDNAQTVALRGAPFVLNGDTYVPLASIATLGNARYSVDTHRHIVNLMMRSGVGYEPVATMPPDQPDQPEDVSDLSPLLALAIKPAATADAMGLHMRAEIANTTTKPYVLAFPTADQFIFVVARNGSEVWTSAAASPAATPSTFRLGPGSSTTIVADWPGFAKAGPGRYSLRVRLVKAIPIDSAPVSLDSIAPTASP